MRPLLSIVAPAFEEERALPMFHEHLARVLDSLDNEYDVEVIYVDDGSADGTLTVLRHLSEADRRVRYLSLSRNFGHQAALTAGLEHATGDLIITMDADLQHPPEIIPRLLREWKKGAAVVLTIRADDPSLKWSKRLGSRMFYRLMRWMSGTEVRPSAADFRLMTRPAVDALLQLGESHRFIRGMVQWLGFPCREVHFTPHSRVAGRSKYTLTKQLSLGLDGMFSFSKLPLRAVTGAGGIMLLAGLGALGWECADHLMGASYVCYATLALGACFFLFGTVMLGLGIVGEYVGRIYEQVKNRPVYVLKEESRAVLRPWRQYDEDGPVDRHQPTLVFSAESGNHPRQAVREL